MTSREGDTEAEWAVDGGRRVRRGWLLVAVVVMGFIAVFIEVRPPRDRARDQDSRARAVLGGALVDADFIARRMRGFEQATQTDEAKPRREIVDGVDVLSGEGDTSAPVQERDIRAERPTAADAETGLGVSSATEAGRKGPTATATHQETPAARPTIHEVQGAAPKAREAPQVRPEAGVRDAADKVPETRPEPSRAQAEPPVDASLTEASALAEQRRWREARAIFDKVLAAHPGNATALLGRARCRSEQQDSAGALADLEALLKSAPRHPQALLMAGSVAQDLGRNDDARRFYRRYLDAWPDGRKANEVTKILANLR